MQPPARAHALSAARWSNGRLAKRLARAVAAATQPAPVTQERALHRMERLDAITMLVSSAEHLARPQDRVRGGFNDWPVARRGLHSRAPRLGRVIDVVARPGVTRAMHLTRVGASLALIAPSGRRTRTTADAAIVGTSLLLHPRNHYGTDGTDQVGFLVAAAGALARVAHRRPRLVDAALWTVALQATLSYGASGWVKATSETWRSGRALSAVARTRTYGDPRMYRMLMGHPRLTRVLGVSVLAMECLFPTVYVWGGRVAPAWLHGVGFFHLVNARAMGLGRFVWAFGSMHPAVLYTTDRRNRGVRDDTMPKVTAMLGAGALFAGGAAQARRRRRVLSTGVGEERFATRRRSDLAFRRHGAAWERDDTTVVVLEHALLSSPTLWGWTARALAERHPVVTYARAGYAASTYAPATPYRLERAVDDLVDLAAHVSEGRRGVVVAGHSLGGWLAVGAAERAPDLVRGIALVDSSHPGELERSSRQAKGQKAITTHLQTVGPSLSVGLGNLVAPPEFDLPAPEDDRFLDEFRDARMWTAGLREWRATEVEFTGFSGTLPRLACPVLALTAEYTARLDPIQAELHRELADALHEDGRHVVIAGVDHEGILTKRRAAEEVAGLVADLTDRTAHAHARQERWHVAA